MKLIQTAAAVAISALFTSAAFAQAPAGWDRRDARQDHRIEQGVRSGQITQREEARLQQGAARIDRLEDRALRDGRVTAQERNRIDRAQDHQSREIYRQSHDGQTANRGYGPSHNMHAQTHRDANHGRPALHGQTHRDGNHGRPALHGQTHRDAYQDRHTSHGGRSSDVGNHGVGRMERGNFGAAHGETRGAAGSHVTRSETRTVAPVQSGRIDVRSGADARATRNEARTVTPVQSVRSEARSTQATQPARNTQGRAIQQASNETRTRR